MSLDAMEQERLQTSARLDRIENKIDRLSEAMIDLARAEEKLINFERVNQQMLDKVELTNTRVHERLDELQKETDANTATVRIINRVSIIVITAIAGIVVKIFGGV